MTKKSYHTVHAKFKLNGSHFTREELYDVACTYVTKNDEYLQNTGDFLLRWLDDSDFVMVQTSGTTGKPKQIKLTKQAMINSALATGSFFDLKPSDSALCCLPVKYIAGKMMMVRAIVLGLEMDLVEPKLSPLKATERKYDFAAMVPLQVENSLDKIEQIKQLIIGGAKVDFDLVSKIKETDCKAYETYSMTETITHIAAKRVGAEAFTILPKIKISLDGRGCLVIDAPELNPDRVVTNDLVSILSATEFIWNGRIDNVINSGGIKIFPEQIEEKLADKIANRFFIGSMKDKILGEKIILIVEGEENKIEDMIFRDLAKYEKPKAIFYIPKFMETETGKIKRKEIMEILEIKNPA